MPNLRDMLDGKTLDGGLEAASPLAKHVSDHMQDPVGATKEGFGKLTKSKLEYDQAREEMQRNLAPVQTVIDHVSQLHNLTNRVPPTGMPGDPNNPNDPMNQDPNMANQFQDEEGNPPMNMNQTAGKMNQSRPSLVGNQPGVAPGDGQTVRPPKLGQAQPGGPGARNAPGPGNAQGNQYNKSAKSPKGSKTLPGAKGPGDSKVQNKVKKAQSGTTGRQIKVNVSAALDTLQAASYSNLESSFALGVLKTAAAAIPVGTIRAGAAQANDKVTDNEGDNVAYNPVIRSKKMKAKESPRSTPRVPGSRSKPFKPGTAGPEGHNRKIHQPDIMKDNMSAGGPGSGRRPGGGQGKQESTKFATRNQRLAHEMLVKNGFQFKTKNTGYNSRGETVRRNAYTHPEHSPIAIEPDGAFNHGMSGDGTFRQLSGHLRSIMSSGRGL